MIDFTIKSDDNEQFDVTADTRDVYVWEKRSGGKKTLADLGNKPAMVDLYSIAYQASRRTGHIPTAMTEPQFAERFLLDFEFAQDPPDPTQPEA